MSAVQFEAKPYKIGTWTVLRLPPAASAKLPSRGQVMTTGTINGVALQTALEPDGAGSHWFRVDKSLQKSAKVSSGSTARLTLASTKDWPEPTIPADWQTALGANARVKALWEDITPMSRWEWLRWIGSTKQADTRKQRIQVSCDKLLKGWRRPCCFNRNMSCVPDVSKNGVLLPPDS
jgi:hypothetical protein